MRRVCDTLFFENSRHGLFSRTLSLYWHLRHSDGCGGGGHEGARLCDFGERQRGVCTGFDFFREPGHCDCERLSGV